MGRLRKYSSNAERQQAFRERREVETVRVDRAALDRLHAKLERLQAAVRGAAAAGDGAARACRAVSVETVLEKLIHYFEECGRGS